MKRFKNLNASSTHLLGTSFSGGHGSAKLMVGLDDLYALFQPKSLYDSMIL